MKLENELKNTELFSNLGGISLARLSAGCTKKTVETGRFIFHEGDEGNNFFLLVSGKARVYKNSRDGKEVTVKIISPGEIFGEVILFENSIYPANCTAVETSDVLSISKKTFLDLLSDSTFAADFFGILIGKMRYLNERILYLSALDVEERFFSFIRSNYGIHDSYTISLIKKDIASAIGTIPETFSRMLARLKKSGLARWDDNLIIDRQAWEIYDQ